jgi:hypothetical protein
MQVGKHIKLTSALPAMKKDMGYIQEAVVKVQNHIAKPHMSGATVVVISHLQVRKIDAC